MAKIEVKVKKQQIVAANNTDLKVPTHRTVVDLFRDQVNRVPKHTAVIYEGRTLTYSELDSYSN